MPGRPIAQPPAQRLGLLCRALLAGLLLASCGPDAAIPEGDGDGEGIPVALPSENGPADPNAMLAPGGLARVTADFLNLRDGVGTSAQVLTAMPCGATMQVLEGPSADPSVGWWRVDYTSPDGSHLVGWASGKFLVAAEAFVEGSCGASGADDAGVGPPPVVSQIFDRAKLGVGYSYWWGHGAWRSDGTNHGSCAGSCPSCDHSGSYGADCSGYIAKVWQVPSPSALAVDQHPYSTLNFYNEQTHWRQLARDGIQPADALVRRANGAGHIVLYESGDDPYGAVWIYEARGCAYGVTHNLRPIDSSYRTIRRSGL